MSVNQGGRPKANFSIQLVRNLSARGLTQQQQSDCLGVSLSCYKSRLNDDDEFRQAVEIGASDGVREAVEYLREIMISKGSQQFAAIKFYLQSVAPEVWNPDYKPPTKAAPVRSLAEPQQARAFIAMHSKRERSEAKAS